MQRGKKGQMYMIAAIVIIALIVGFFAISNYSKKTDVSKVEDLANELREESSRVIDYESYSSDNKIDEFTGNFSQYAGSDVTIIYLVGSASNFEVYTYNGSVKDVLNEPQDYVQNGNTITLNVLDNSYDFEMREGKNFYFVIYQKIGDEIYVAKS